MTASHTPKLQHHLKTIFNILLAVTICLAVAGIHSVRAAPPSQHYYVDNISDVRINTGCQDGVSDGDCDLRGAVDLANAGSSAYWHYIHLPAGTYTLTLPGGDSANAIGDLDVFGNTTIIEGAGMNDTIITQSGTSDRIFDLRGDDGLKLMNLTVSGGRVGSGSGAGIRGISVGAILTLENVRITDNRATSTNDGDRGGGVFLYSTYLSIRDSIIDTNRAQNGAGLAIYNVDDVPTATIINSTIHDNITNGGNGGGIWAGAHSQMDLENVTIANNLADGDGWGGGIYINGNLVFNLNHVTVANNWASYMGDAIAGDYLVHLDIDNSILYYTLGNDVCYYPTGTTLYISSNSHNITNESGDDWCHIGGLSGTDPLLGNLDFYHSITQTLPLLTGSPAIDGAITDDPVTTDQRGKPRYDGDEDGTIESDIGAHENCLEFFLPLIIKP